MINFTIIIQACNFFIVYKLLRALFFKPAVQLLYAERTFKQTLELNLDATNIMIAQHNQEKENQLYQFKKNSAQFIPNAQYSDLFILKNIAHDLQVNPLDSVQIKNFEQELAQSIIKKVEHVYE